jgi:hypothetical protein
VPSYLQLTAPTIAGLHGSRRAATLPTKAAEAPCKAAVAVRALVAYSPQTGDVLDMADKLLGVAVSMSVHHAAADDQAVWRLMVVLADNEFTQQVLIIVAPNLLMANTTVWPNIGMHANLHKVRWILQSQPQDDGQVQAQRRVDYVRVCQVHGPRHVGLPPAPTRLLVDDDDNRNDHFDIPG